MRCTDRLFAIIQILRDGQLHRAQDIADRTGPLDMIGIGAGFRTILITRSYRYPRRRRRAIARVGQDGASPTRLATPARRLIPSEH